MTTMKITTASTPTTTSTTTDPTTTETTKTTATGKKSQKKFILKLKELRCVQLTDYSHFIHKFYLYRILGCNVRESVAVDVGWFGISRSECLAKGMCWKTWNGPWCYKPNSK